MQEVSRVFFLDRDGVINKKAPPHQYITSWDDFIFLPGIFDFLRELQAKRYKLIIITNQQGIGKGIYTEIDLERIHSKMLAELDKARIRIEAIYYCPHLEADNCSCRKPKPGMLERADRELNVPIDKARSYFVGDSESDVLAAQRYGVAAFYLSSSAPLYTKPEYVVSEYSEIIKHISSSVREGVSP